MRSLFSRLTIVLASTLALCSYGLNSAPAHAAGVNSCPWAFNSTTTLSALPNAQVSWTFNWSCTFAMSSLNARSYLANAAGTTVANGTTRSCSGTTCKGVQTDGSATVIAGTTNVVHVVLTAVLNSGQAWIQGDTLTTVYCSGWNTRTLSCHYEFPAVAVPGAIALVGEMTGGGI